jgi:hypothetical protein
MFVDSAERPKTEIRGNRDKCLAVLFKLEHLGDAKDLESRTSLHPLSTTGLDIAYATLVSAKFIY